MPQPRLTGPGAGSDKYDILTALAVAGLAQGGHLQISLLRLMAVVTARYNWNQDELTIGQREMAQLWSVDERTAKREVKRLIEAGLLTLERAGVKGRVACYKLDFKAIRALTEPHWSCVGPDFEARMSERHSNKPEASKPAKVVQVDFAARQRLPEPKAETPWARVKERLSALDEARYLAWFAPLELTSESKEALILVAPTRFAAQYLETHLRRDLETAILQEYGPGLRCEIRAPR